MEVLLTPRFFDDPNKTVCRATTTWSPTKFELPNNYVSLAFNAGAYDWDNPPPKPATTADGKASPLESKDPPSTIYIFRRREEDDDVSLLNDDPDDDDNQLLPSSTYDVLMPLLEDMYKDESEGENEDA